MAPVFVDRTGHLAQGDGGRPRARVRLAARPRQLGNTGQPPRVLDRTSVLRSVYLFLALALALVVEFILKTTRSALLSWHAMHFVRNVEHEAISRLLRAQDGAFEHEPAAVARPWEICAMLR